MEDFASETDSEGQNTWRRWFVNLRGNEYFCEIDEEYLNDKFNLTNISPEVQYYQYALELATDELDVDCDEDMRDAIEKSARHLYGLVHARYITSARGLTKMLEKHKLADFGKCPRVICHGHPLLPTGMSDVPNVQSVKLYCSSCEDLYNPKSSRHSSIDGAYFGTSFVNLLCQTYPVIIPSKSIERFQPRVFGFKLHAAAALDRWQGRQRIEMEDRLRQHGITRTFRQNTTNQSEVRAGNGNDDDDAMEQDQRIIGKGVPA